MHCCDNLKCPKEAYAIKTRLENIHDYPVLDLVVQRVWERSVMGDTPFGSHHNVTNESAVPSNIYA